MATTQKVRKWGNSLAVRIPREAAERAGLRGGDSVAVSASSGKLTLARKPKRLSIDDLLDRMTPENQPEVIDWGPPVGKEIW